MIAGVQKICASPRVWLLLLALALPLSASDGSNACQLRNCLPPDATQSPPLCYTAELTLHGVLAQSFAACPQASPHCELCTSELPCESFCRAQPLAARPPGADCYFDEECSGNFSQCLQRVCRRALHTHQRCDSDDPNDVCLFGQRTCFRGRCQGLTTGDHCSAHPEGRDIDCKKGWYCFFGVCTPQLPAGHSCSGQHPNECLSGHRCNKALQKARCNREYTLDLGELSSEPSLCKSNHISPAELRCAEVPPVVSLTDNPAALDCTEDSQCQRTDGSVGECACKRWWEGQGTPGYCELSVQDSGRPSLKRFWEVRLRLCHHDWSDERCAKETGLLETLREINADRERLLNDPTHTESCGRTTLATDTSPPAGAARGRLCPAVLAALAVLAPSSSEAS